MTNKSAKTVTKQDSARAVEKALANNRSLKLTQGQRQNLERRVQRKSA